MVSKGKILLFWSACKVSSVRTLITKLKEVQTYLDLMQKKPKQYPYNAAVVGKLQDLFNELPESCLGQIRGGASSASDDVEMDGPGATGEEDDIVLSEEARACTVETNDHYMWSNFITMFCL